tara:strand:- start:541 stop:717 length:177 start_codon:yes stop_codon:yes gene_type:complete
MKEDIGYVTKPNIVWLPNPRFTYIGIPNEFLEALKLTVGEPAKIKFDGEKIIIEKIKK